MPHDRHILTHCRDTRGKIESSIESIVIGVEYRENTVNLVLVLTLRVLQCHWELSPQCSTLTLEDYKRITSAIPDQSDTKLKLYDQSVIHPVGSTKLYCTDNGSTKKVHFEIVEHASTTLLSGRASEALELIHFNEEYLMQVNPSSDTPLNQEQVLREYHGVFSGLGKLPGTYHIDMDPNAKAVQENP